MLFAASRLQIQCARIQANNGWRVVDPQLAQQIGGRSLHRVNQSVPAEGKPASRCTDSCINCGLYPTERLAMWRMWHIWRLLAVLQAMVQIAGSRSSIASDITAACAVTTMQWSVAVQPPAHVAKVALPGCRSAVPILVTNPFSVHAAAAGNH